MIKTGIIGFGYAARTFHIPLILSVNGLQLVAVSTSQPDVFAEHYPAINYPAIKRMATASELLESGDVELVVITAPNDMHFPLARDALQHGCHVVLEKPMTTNAGEARELIALAQSKGRVLSVFHNRRWDSDFLTVRKLLASGRLGSVRYVDSHFDRFRPVVRQRWREQPGKGTGIWFDLGSHLVDQALVLFGLPESVTARCLALRDGSAATDYFHVQLHYDRLEVVLHASLFAAGENLRFRLEGDRGTYVKTGLDVQEEQLKSGMNPGHAQFGLEHITRAGILSTATVDERIPSERGCYHSYYAGIVEAIIGLKKGAAPPVRAAEAMQVMRILELAESSSREGKTLRTRQDDH